MVVHQHLSGLYLMSILVHVAEQEGAGAIGREFRQALHTPQQRAAHRIDVNVVGLRCRCFANRAGHLQGKLDGAFVLAVFVLHAHINPHPVATAEVLQVNVRRARLFDVVNLIVGTIFLLHTDGDGRCTGVADGETVIVECGITVVYDRLVVDGKNLWSAILRIGLNAQEHYNQGDNDAVVHSEAFSVCLII